MMLEKTIKNHVRNRLKKLGAYYFFPVQMGLGESTVDILACYKGQFIGIETKAPGGKLTERQIFVLEKIARAGGYAVVIDSKEKVDEFLTADSLSR